MSSFAPAWTSCSCPNAGRHLCDSGDGGMSACGSYAAAHPDYLSQNLDWLHPSGTGCSSALSCCGLLDASWVE